MTEQNSSGDSDAPKWQRNHQGRLQARFASCRDSAPCPKHSRQREGYCAQYEAQAPVLGGEPDPARSSGRLSVHLEASVLHQGRGAQNARGAAMSRPWYRRFPDNFIAGTVGLTLEEKGAYSLVLDLMYVRGGPVPDEPRYIAGVCNCSVRKWNAIRAKLIADGKIHVVNGYLTNDRAEKEIENAAKDAQERAENGAKGGNKTAENRTKDNENNGRRPASVQPTRATLHQNQIKKESDFNFSGGQGAEGIQLDRWADEALFAACERLTGKPVPGYIQKKTFPVEIVSKARAEA